MRIIAAGGAAEPYTSLCLKLKISKLYSALNEKKLINSYPTKSGWLMVDSGAFSWNTSSYMNKPTQRKLPKIEDYAKTYLEFCLQQQVKNRVFVELDCYAHLKKEFIDEMWQEMKRQNPKNIFIRVYHPSLDQGSLKILDQWLEDGNDYIGIAGDGISYLDAVFARTKNKIRVHGFAMTKYKKLLKYPFYSVDSTTCLVSSMYGSKNGKNLKQTSKIKMISQKDPWLFHDCAYKYETSLKELKRMETFITSLWKSRGVDWHAKELDDCCPGKT
jgi:hypothetical protein